MRIKLTNHYWSGKFTQGIEFDTPTGLNSTHLLSHDEISKKNFEHILAIVISMPESYDIQETDDGKNKTYIIKPLYIKL